VVILYPGLFLKLTVSLMDVSSLCSFMVPCICGDLGFMFLYFHLSVCLIVLLHVLKAVKMFFFCLLV
jgi:hypothetical protein